MFNRPFGSIGVILGITLGAMGCQGVTEGEPAGAPTPARQAQGLRAPPSGHVDEEVITDARGVVSRRVQRYSDAEVASGAPIEPLRKEDAPAEPAGLPPRVEPLLEQRLAQLAPDALVDVVIGVEASTRMAALPRLLAGERRESPGNQLRLAARQAEFDLERVRREASQRPVVELVRAAGGEVLEQFTLCNCFSARVPARLVSQLAAEPSVRHIDPRFTDDPPPADTNPDNDLADGRARVNSDVYFNNGYDGNTVGYYVGVLDTGIRSTHTLFTAPDHIAFERDCTYGGTNCESTGNVNYNPDDGCWNHGTSTIGIITGNANLGADWRGMTNAWVDSWKVYPGCSGLDVTAAIKGFDRAVYWGDDVIVAEMQASLSETSNLSVAADTAFDAGAIVIAANGNYGPNAGTVKSPANAHKAMGVGAYNIQTLATPSYQSRGPTADNRFKPDFQAPTDTETASTACTTCLQAFGGTSGATPYGSGAAMVLRDWYEANGFGVEPGKIYAGLLAFGSHPYPYDNEEGAGDLKLGNLYCRRWLTGSRTVSQGQAVDISFATVDTQTDLQVAIWWPEGTTYHNDIDLRIYDPANTLRGYGSSRPSVFEMDTVPGPLTPAGTWRVQLYGYSVPQGPQTVYFLVYHKVAGCGG